jgi:hypothetical protein
MDNIRQYQRLSEIKPSYQKLVKPYFSVSRAKIQHNAVELDLYYKGLGIWEDIDSKTKNKTDDQTKYHKSGMKQKKRRVGGDDSDNKKEKVILWNLELDDNSLLEI